MKSIAVPSPIAPEMSGVPASNVSAVVVPKYAREIADAWIIVLLVLRRQFLVDGIPPGDYELMVRFVNSAQGLKILALKPDVKVTVNVPADGDGHAKVTLDMSKPEFEEVQP